MNRKFRKLIQEYYLWTYLENDALVAIKCPIAAGSRLPRIREGLSKICVICGFPIPQLFRVQGDAVPF
jgi:hypothetical protein